jgi:hypothetical protein
MACSLMFCEHAWAPTEQGIATRANVMQHDFMVVVGPGSLSQIGLAGPGMEHTMPFSAETPQTDTEMPLTTLTCTETYWNSFQLFTNATATASLSKRIDWQRQITARHAMPPNVVTSAPHPCPFDSACHFQGNYLNDVKEHALVLPALQTRTSMNQ